MTTLKINNVIFNNINLIIFDKDGTLFELYPYWKVIANKRAELICDKIKPDDYNDCVYKIAFVMGIDNKNKCMKPESPIGIHTRPFIQDLVYNKLINDRFTLVKDDVVSAFNETDTFMSTDNNTKSALVMVDGLEMFLDKVTANNCKCAIISHDNNNNISRCIKSVGIDKYFSNIIGGDDVKFHKPNPESVFKTMDLLNISPNNTLFIGDMQNDLLCGHNASCMGIIARRSELTNVNTNPITINDFNEIEVIE